MDNNNINPQSNNSNTQKPTFLSSENPDVLKNVDIKTTSVQPKANTVIQDPISDPSTGYASPYSSPYSGQNQVQPQIPVQQQAPIQPVSSQREAFSPQQQYQQFTPPQQQLPNNYQNQSTFGANLANQADLPKENPFATKTNVVYKSEGGGFLGRVLQQIFSTIGCLLLIVSVVVIAFIYFVNF